MVSRGRRASIAQALTYTDAVLEETGQVAPPVGQLSPAAFLSAAPDGRDMGSLLDQAVIQAKAAVRTESARIDEAGFVLTSSARSQAGLQTALAAGEQFLSMALLTVMADTRREVYAADLVRRPLLTGYVRMLNTPSCSRCVLLAGKWFRWNEGFDRHPRCDCQHIPGREDVAGDLRTDPYEYFNSLSRADQNRYFGKADAQAIRDGGDIYRVVNIRSRGLATARAGRKYGTPTRITIDDIYAAAGNDRDRAIELMRQEGFITGPQRRGGNIIGRFHESYSKPISRPITPGSKRDRVLRARETGVRDPLDRATMTAAERRLHDAVFRREYARKYGYLPRTVGQNSADLYSGLVGLPATRERVELLDAEISRYLSRITPAQQSLTRLVDALGLRADEFTTQQIFRELLEPRIGLAALRPHIVLQARKGRSTTSAQGWRHQQAFAERKLVERTAAGGFPPGKGPPKLPPAFPPDPDRWPEDLPPLTRDRWAHILYGDTNGGGHMHGHGWLHGKSEFPEGWDESTILQAMVAVLRADPIGNRAAGGGTEHAAQVRGVKVKVRVGALGKVATAFPTER